MKARYYLLSLLIAIIAIMFPAWNAIAKELKGLVFYFPFEEQEPVDHSPNPTKVSSVKGNLKRVEGKFGKASEFDGATYIEVAHSDKLEGMTALTIEAWIKLNKIPAEGMAIASKRNAYNVEDVYNLFVYTGTKMDARVNASADFFSQTVFKTGEWYHVAYVFDGNAKDDQKQKMYVNGVLESNATHAAQAVGKGGAPLWVGELDSARGFKWNGVIDELGIWDIALSDNDIKLVMEAGKEKMTPVEPQEKLATTWGDMKKR